MRLEVITDVRNNCRVFCLSHRVETVIISTFRKKLMRPKRQ